MAKLLQKSTNRDHLTSERTYQSEQKGLVDCVSRTDVDRMELRRKPVRGSAARNLLPPAPFRSK